MAINKRIAREMIDQGADNNALRKATELSQRTLSSLRAEKLPSRGHA